MLTKLKWSGGACGYGNLYDAGYGTRSTALSTALFNNGAMCGACFAIACDAGRSRWCKPGAASVTVTATNLCPPNWALPGDAGGWCNPPRRHFDMSQPAWEAIAVYRAGIVPVNYRRVPCRRAGGVRFTVQGRSYFELVTVANVGGSGVVAQAWVKGSATGWMAMSRNWGANWQSNAYLNGQGLSFRLRADDGRVVTAYNVAAAGWRFGATYTSNVQFY
ncbi:Expansin-A8 [Zea mays]|uniref:Expansin n=1 Tax=Zea mays TaxID=4577 RepID=A0A3L6FCH0_MAIZE|nr:Expansin-A8 [Zea mays]